MLEIILVIFWWRKMGELIRKKGYPRTIGFQLLVPIRWFGGEFLGGVLYATAMNLEGKPAAATGLPVYGVALVSAAVLTTILFAVAKGFPPSTQVPPPVPPQG